MPHYDKYANRKKPEIRKFNVKVGQNVIINTYSGNDRTDPKRGKVVWIHPEKEFAVVEFKTASGESYRSAFRNLNGQLMADNH